MGSDPWNYRFRGRCKEILIYVENKFEETKMYSVFSRGGGGEAAGIDLLKNSFLERFLDRIVKD